MNEDGIQTSLVTEAEILPSPLPGREDVRAILSQSTPTYSRASEMPNGTQRVDH